MVVKIIFNVLLNGFSVFVAAYLLPGIKVDNYFTAILVAIVLGVVNAFLKPILVFLTLPINIITFGLFVFVINALLVMLVGAVVPGFMVSNFLWALLFSLILSLINSFMHSLAR